MNRKNIVLLFIIGIVAVGTVYSQQPAKKKKLTWKKYHSLCGSDNAKREDHFKRVKGKTVLWKGKFVEKYADPGLQGDRVWASDTVRIKMDPSDSIIADVRLKIRKEFAGKIDSLEKGDRILFQGKVMYLGTKLSDHVVEVSKFKKGKKPPSQ